MNSPLHPPEPHRPSTNGANRPGIGRRSALVGLAAAFATPVIGTAVARAAGPSQGAGTRAADPDLGPNVLVFDPSMSTQEIQSQLDSVFATQESAEFGQERYALLFKPGDYQDIDVNVGFYTHVAGLGASPDDVDITGWVHVEADWFEDGNATHNFWRAAENLSVTPWDGVNRWAVSQAAPMRRVHIRGEVPLWNGYDGWASGGYIADSKVDDRVVSGSQQQFLTRNSSLGEWAGSVWNMVFVGVEGAPPHHFPDPSHTVVDSSPVIREKPFLCVDGESWQVFVPALRTDAAGTTWEGGAAEGESLPLDQFEIITEGASAAEINAALGDGKDLLITPGIYELDETIEIDREDTVVLGLGLATLVPQGGITALKIGDVAGVKVSGLLIDAGEENSETLMEVGTEDAGDFADNPVLLQDVFFRIGGAHVGRATTSLVINSGSTLADHLWLWRGDHGDGVGWDVNTADTALVVNGADTTVYGLFAEHYQKNEVEWNADGGRTYFFQNEMPYDPPNQAAYMDGERNGYPAYKVDDSVTTHEGVGFGSYCLFLEDATIVNDAAIEAPDADGVSFLDMVTVSLGGLGTISHIVNDAGDPVTPDNEGIAYLVNYP